MTPPEPMGLIAAFVVGLAGSAHCFGMCGGIAGALKLHSKSLHGESKRGAVDSLGHQIGRILTYSVLGATVGACGGFLQSLMNLTAIGNVLRAISGVLLLMIAARLLVGWNGLAPLERLGALIWKATQPFTKRISPDGALSALIIGMAWGLLPCAMVYSALTLAALSGSAFNGATLMAAFGLGTTPALLAGTALFSLNGRFGSARRISGALLVLFGLWMIAAPFVATTHHGGHELHAMHVH